MVNLTFKQYAHCSKSEISVTRIYYIHIYHRRILGRFLPIFGKYALYVPFLGLDPGKIGLNSENG